MRILPEVDSVVNDINHLNEQFETKTETGIKIGIRTEIETLEHWLDKHRFYTFQTLYEHFPKCILNKENCHMKCNDYNHHVFEKFLNVEPIITVEYFYICIGYIFNINYSIKNMISKMLNIEKKSD